MANAVESKAVFARDAREWQSNARKSARGYYPVVWAGLLVVSIQEQVTNTIKAIASDILNPSERAVKAAVRNVIKPHFEAAESDYSTHTNAALVRGLQEFGTLAALHTALLAFSPRGTRGSMQSACAAYSADRRAKEKESAKAASGADGAEAEAEAEADGADGTEAEADGTRILEANTPIIPATDREAVLNSIAARIVRDYYSILGFDLIQSALAELNDTLEIKAVERRAEAEAARKKREAEAEAAKRTEAEARQTKQAEAEAAKRAEAEALELTKAENLLREHAARGKRGTRTARTIADAEAASAASGKRGKRGTRGTRRGKHAA